MILHKKKIEVHREFRERKEERYNRRAAVIDGNGREVPSVE